MNKLVTDIPSSRLSYEFLHSLNGIIGLTERELQVFSILLDLYMSNPRSREAIDCTSNRKHLMLHANVTRDNLSRYIKVYKRKGLLTIDKQAGKLMINPAIVPVVIGGKSVQITMILKLKGDN